MEKVQPVQVDEITIGIGKEKQTLPFLKVTGIGNVQCSCCSPGSPCVCSVSSATDAALSKIKPNLSFYRRGWHQK